MRGIIYRVQVVFLAFELAAVVVCTLCYAALSLEKDISKIQPEADAWENSVSRPVMEYKAGNLKDPFEGYKQEETGGGVPNPEAPRPALPPMQIKGVVWGGDIPQAIINNKVVKVGDTIEGAKIVSIDKLGIKLLFAGKIYDLTTPSGPLFQSLEKQAGGKDEK